MNNRRSMTRFLCGLFLPFVFCALLTCVHAGGALPFSDVSEDAWYYADVLEAYESGLIDGKSASSFAPDDPLKRSEVVKLAACMYQTVTEGEITLGNGEGIWYEPYVDYAFDVGILTESMDFDEAATRGETMELFSRAIPNLEAINDVPEDAVTDVPQNHPHHDAVYKMLRAGIVQGVDETTHVCAPDTNITRAEIAAILTRMMHPESRISFVWRRTYSALTLEWAANYENRFGAGASEEIFMNAEEIAAYNARMTAQCPEMVDMTAYPDTVSGQTVRAMIEKYSMPEGYDYDLFGNLIGWMEKQTILDNRALAQIPETVNAQYAVIGTRCDLKGFPTEKGFYAYGDRYYSMIQETELIVGMPAVVLHESSDGRFLFVQTYYYAGWIPCESAITCGKDDFLRYAMREDVVTVTVAQLEAIGVQKDWVNGDFVGTLDMGVSLPYLGEDARYYYAEMPYRGSDGTLRGGRIRIPREEAVHGFLPYTMANFYEEAFSCLGVMYGWGGAEGGMDCSGFVCAIMRTFGIYLPRNTSEQRNYSGVGTDLQYLGASDRAAVLNTSRFPTAIHLQGHVMLYLGEANGTPTIIHAYAGGIPILTDELDLSSPMLRAVELQ